ncbi:hypothetical protein [Kitasatospora nipponensis]|uniref:hypothetical protein n=1 Tax=Kitasatospora nipponensis TaxID=258049 RepID=UPI0031E313F4
MDSFGLGMTLFYLCSGKDPYPGQHTGVQWRGDVHQATSAITGTTWQSLPRRYARCVVGATAEGQLARIDVPAIHDEMSRLRAAHLDPEQVTDTELLAEGIAARSEAMRNYEWDADTSSAFYAPPTGVVYQLQGDESKARILLDISFTSRGQHDRSNLTKYLNSKGPGVVGALRKGKWHVTDEQHGQGQLKVSAWIDADQARQGLDRFPRTVDVAGDLLRF